jgi:transposase
VTLTELNPLAHHLRELTRAWEQDEQAWAKEMGKFLVDLHRFVDEAGGVLDHKQEEQVRQDYRSLLEKAHKECPPPQKPPDKVQRGFVE